MLVLQSPSATFVALRRGGQRRGLRAAPRRCSRSCCSPGRRLRALQLGRGHLHERLRLRRPPRRRLGLPRPAPISGAFAYWLLGGVLHLAVRALGSHGTFRRSRHLLAFAAAPSPARCCSGRSRSRSTAEQGLFDGAAGRRRRGELFEPARLAFALWAAALLVVGVRAVHGWSWARASGGERRAAGARRRARRLLALSRPSRRARAHCRGSACGGRQRGAEALELPSGAIA